MVYHHHNGSVLCLFLLFMCLTMVLIISIEFFRYSYVLLWCVSMIFLCFVDILLFGCSVVLLLSPRPCLASILALQSWSLRPHIPFHHNSFYTVSIASKTIDISETALEASKTNRILLWAYGELPIRSIFIISPNSAETLHIIGRAPSHLFEDDVYVISADKKRITVPINAVNIIYVSKILSR
jgi:hypothetical protein